MIEILFVVFGGLAVLSALVILFSKSVIYAGLGLLSVLVNMAALFVLAGSEFLAVTQLLVYAGGILVLMLFGIMLTGNQISKSENSERSHRFLSGILGTAFFVLLFFLINQVNFDLIAWMSSGQTAVGEGILARIGILLMSEYVLAFEIAGVLLLLALVAAAYLVGKHSKVEKA
jgi:NADH-quinone oxidoreductase subunit J